MSKAKVTLVPLEQSDRNQFVLDNQEAFKYGATEEFITMEIFFAVLQLFGVLNTSKGQITQF